MTCLQLECRCIVVLLPFFSRGRTIVSVLSASVYCVPATNKIVFSAEQVSEE